MMRGAAQLRKSLALVVGARRGAAIGGWGGGVGKNRLKTSGILGGWGRVQSKKRRCVIKLIRQEERDDSSQQQPDESCVFYVPPRC